MLKGGVIKLVEESEWIIQVVVQYKKIGGYNNLCRLEEIERCMPAGSIPNTFYKQSTGKRRWLRGLFIHKWFFKVPLDKNCVGRQT
jgi:hypothetical protein